MEFIAIDIGTSFTKGAIVNVESLEIQHIVRQAAARPLLSENPLFHEIDAQSILVGVKKIIEDLVSRCSDLNGILLCGQMGGLVLSSEIGTALRPYISWVDRRLNDIASGNESWFDRFSDDIGSEAKTILGNEFRPGLPISFLYWLKQSGKLDGFDGAVPVTLPDFIAAALCRTKPVMEWTATTGTLNITNRCLPLELFSRLQIENLQWPEIVSFRHQVGVYNECRKPLPVYAAVGDHQCSLAGTLLSDDELSINISTGSQVSSITNSTATGDYQLRPYFDGRMLKTITNIPAGRALNAIMNLLTEIGGDSIDSEAAWNRFFEAAETTPSSDVAVNLAFFPGAIHGPGSFTNLREENLNVGHIARASLEQMAAYYLQLSDRLDSAHPWARLAFSGGIAQRSKFLRERISCEMNLDYRLATSTEDALFGMIVLGRVIGGLESTVAEATTNVAAMLND